MITMLFSIVSALFLTVPFILGGYLIVRLIRELNEEDCEESF